MAKKLEDMSQDELDEAEAEAYFEDEDSDEIDEEQARRYFEEDED